MYTKVVYTLPNVQYAFHLHFICIPYVYAQPYQLILYKQGVLKPDGHTVSVSDLFFIAHSLGMMARRPHAPYA